MKYFGRFSIGQKVMKGKKGDCITIPCSHVEYVSSDNLMVRINKEGKPVAWGRCNLFEQRYALRVVSASKISKEIKDKFKEMRSVNMQHFNLFK